MATTFNKTYQITAGENDGYFREELSTGVQGLYPDNNFIRIGETDTYIYHMYLMFENIDIPYGSTINSAYIKLKSYESDTDNNTIRIYVADIDVTEPPYNADEFMDLYSNKSSIFATWDISNLDEDVWYDSIDISTLIQRNINNTWWTSGKYIYILIRSVDSYGIINFHDYESMPSYAPQLVVSYSLPNIVPTTPTQFYAPTGAISLDAGLIYSVRWSASSDVDGNLAGYYIYRSLNGGSYSYIATTSATQYSVTIPTGGYSNVRYKIIAYDTEGASSGGLISALITIINNAYPTLVVKNTNDVAITNNQSILLSSTDDYLLKITPNDTDTDQTIQYSIIIRGITYVAYTTCTKNVQITYSIPYADLMLGNNVVQVKVKDSKNAITTLSFTLKNGVPEALDFRNVKTILNSFGYTNTGFSCLNDLKPTGYSKTVLSMSDILNSL
jgi:hypothetical protein